MDKAMMDKVTMQAIRSAEISSRILREEMAFRADTMTPIEVAGQTRIADILEAAEMMADAISDFDAATGAGESFATALAKLLEGRDKFRKATLGAG